MSENIAQKSSRFLEQLNSLFGADIRQEQQFLPTGSRLLDLILGGGLPLGQLTILYGEEYGGKTLLGTCFMKSAQAYGGAGVLLELERKFHYPFAEQIGLSLNPDVFVHKRPKSAEEVLKTIEVLQDIYKDAENPVVALWDSIAATGAVDSCEVEKQVGEREARGVDILLNKKMQPANEARLYALAGKRKVFKNLRDTNIAVVATNQVRYKLGGLSFYGDPYKQPGGKALVHNASTILRINGKIKLEGDPVTLGTKTKDVKGIWVHVSVEKNTFGPPNRECYVPVFINGGIDNVLSTLTFLQQQKHCCSGGWYQLLGRKWRKKELWTEAYNSPEVMSALEETLEEAFEEFTNS